MAVSSPLFEDSVDVVPDDSETSDEERLPWDRHRAMLATAHAAIDRTLSRDPVAFLNRNKQARGE